MGSGAAKQSSLRLQAQHAGRTPSQLPCGLEHGLRDVDPQREVRLLRHLHAASRLSAGTQLACWGHIQGLPKLQAQQVWPASTAAMLDTARQGGERCSRISDSHLQVGGIDGVNLPRSQLLSLRVCCCRVEQRLVDVQLRTQQKSENCQAQQV